MTSLLEKKYFENYKGILFDLDGTIVNLHIEWNEVRRNMRKAFIEVCAKDIPETGINTLISTAMALGCENAREIASEILNSYESLAQFDPISDVIELFNSILNKKKIAVVTNNLHSTAERVLRSLGLLNSNVCIVGFNDVKCSKPDPEGILIALQKLNVNKSQAIMIGDSEVDSKAANYAPITFYHVNKLLYMNRKLYEYFGK